MQAARILRSCHIVGVSPGVAGRTECPGLHDGCEHCTVYGADLRDTVSRQAKARSRYLGLSNSLRLMVSGSWSSIIFS